MGDASENQCQHRGKQGKKKHRFVTVAIIAIASAVWFALRTGTKPSRVLYPCQQAALANMLLFKTIAAASLPSMVSLRAAAGRLKPVAILCIISVGGFILAADQVQFGLQPLQTDTRIPIVLTPQTAVNPENASNLFFVQNATGQEGNTDEAVTALIDLMSTEGLHFYNTTTTPDGLIESDDVIIIKMNGQWDYRGGTNTDLIKSVINAIIDHPDGFTGEVVIADNGQGSGNLDRYNPNSYYRNQSAQQVAESFAPDWDVSTILWDNLRYSTVDDYNDGDFSTGYVRSSVWNDDTQLFVSYPKFQSTATGAYISFRQGVWYNDTGFDSDQLKVINMPVLKTHFRYGVTGCIKHYMGVPQGHIVTSVHSSIPHEHFAIGYGGMGTLMAETRMPVLNIMDLTWINAHPLESSDYVGPWSRYNVACATDIIGASLDPVAMDYWTAKHILIPTAEHLNYTAFTSLDPDNESIHVNLYHQQIPQDESFHNYLERSMNELADAGFQVTMDESQMSVFVTALSNAGPVIPTTTGGLTLLSYLPIFVGVGIAVLVIAAILLTRRGSR